jgi:hypothetical protein
MDSLEQKIISLFPLKPKPGSFYITLDPDNLTLDESLHQKLTSTGFKLYHFTNAFEYRFWFETKHREGFDIYQSPPLMILFHESKWDIQTIPYDILRSANDRTSIPCTTNDAIISLDLGTLFPMLHYPVLEKIPYIMLSKLYPHTVTVPKILSENETKEYILQSLFSMEISSINNEIDFLVFILKHVLQELQIPTILQEHMVEKLKTKAFLAQWPIKELCTNKEYLLRFLQEQWALFLRPYRKNTCADDVPGNQIKHDLGLLPFDDPQIKVYMDTLFLENKLTKATGIYHIPEKEKWVHIGIQSNSEEEQIYFLLDSSEELSKRVPPIDASSEKWLAFANQWSEWLSIFYAIVPNLEDSSYKTVHSFHQTMTNNIDICFQEWLSKQYSQLLSIPPVFPKIVHHIPRYLAREIKHSTDIQKIALVVIDGLSLPQWKMIQSFLTATDKYHFESDACYAMIPTLTSLSRQAIFSGKEPFFFPDSVLTTSKEKNLWTNFWKEEGFLVSNIGYIKNINQKEDLNALEESIHLSHTKILGIVINTIDNMMHGGQLGNRGLFHQIKYWLNLGMVHELLQLLLSHNYTIWITSDHGNIECIGQGGIREGKIPELKENRVRVYPSLELANRALSKIPNTILWNYSYLPKDFVPIIAKGNASFAPQNETTVSHGGASIEEVIVPFVKIQGKTS